MKQIDWSKFVVHASGISQILSVPPQARPLSEKQMAAYLKLKGKEDRTPKEDESFSHYLNKIALAIDPPLSKTAINYLTKRFAYEKYAKKMAAKGRSMVFHEKGNILEGEAIELLSKLDKVKYCKNTDVATNEYMLGKCDVYSPERGAILDIKVAWNINTFLSTLNAPLKSLYWYQMQGYLELHDLAFGEVCFCLLNTPEDMVEREKLKMLNNYVFGVINREDYEKGMESLELSLSYDKIPLKRRVIKFRVNRAPEIMPKVYKKVERCREWLTRFDAIQSSGKQIVTLSENYVNIQDENDIEPEP